MSPLVNTPMKNTRFGGPMPGTAVMRTVDERVVFAPVQTIFALAVDVAAWPMHLAHYRGVRFTERTPDGGGIVEMSANRPFGVVQWPTWWRSCMWVNHDTRRIRFRHIAGITTGMEVEWSFRPHTADATSTASTAHTATHVQIVHLWDGPRWPLIGHGAARYVIGPIFVHGIASRTLAGLARVAEHQSESPMGSPMKPHGP